MAAKHLLPSAVLICALAVAGWLGCQTGRSSATGPSDATNSRAPSRPVDYEYRTVETEVPVDPQQAEQDFRLHMQQFRDGGWAVLSISKPLSRPDGKTYRVWRLGRPKL